MSGVALAAVMLAAAVLAAPPPPRRRLGIVSPQRHSRVGTVMLLLSAGAFAMLFFSPAAAIAAGVLWGTGLRLQQRASQRRQARDEGQSLAAVLEIVVGELRTGAHPVRAFTTAAGECGPAVGDVMRAVAARARLGADVAAGLRAAGQHTSVPGYWERVATCWQLAAEHGLGMAALMRTAQGDIIERRRFADRLNAALAGPRATAAILAGLPVLGILLGQLIGADPVGFLLGDGTGSWVLLAGVVLIAAGLAWSDRIIEARTP